MKLFGDGRVALGGDRECAGRLGWGERRRSSAEPECVLLPREGDPRREPWIAPPRWEPRPGASAFWRRPAGPPAWTYLTGVPGVDRYLRAMSRARPVGGVRLGIAGLGRVGGAAATVLAALPARRAGIAEVWLCDRDPANAERWRQELSAVAEWRGPARPTVRVATLEEIFAGCDVFAFAATAGVPPLGSEEDVRLSQFTPNRALLGPFLAAARAAEFAGLFLMISDPVECLAQAAFADSNRAATGRFDGEGLAPERIAGLALGVMWARALGRARERGWAEAVARRGGVFGPHSVEVEVFDDLRAPDAARSADLSEAARFGNLHVRELGFLPYVGPGVSSLALPLPHLLAGREVLASLFLDGVYFGGPARLGWGVHPVAHSLGEAVRERLDALHVLLRRRMTDLGLDFA